ncbi:MAG: Fe-S-containing protein [Treponema sp.]|nr:Fe-S-containing protein [Treponema sp.]
MIRYFILAAENSLAAGIFSAMLFAVVLRTKEPSALKRLALGCAAGSGLSVIVAVLRRTTALINRARLSTGVSAAALAAGVLFLVLYWIDFSGQKKGEKKSPLFLYSVAGVLEAALLFYALPDILLYPSEFTLAGESIVSTDFLFKLAGFAGGLALSALAGFGIFRSAAALPGAGTPVILSAVLVVNMFNQVTGIMRYLIARRIIPLNQALFAVISAAVNNNVVFLYVIMGLSSLVLFGLLAAFMRPRLEYRNPAELRKLRAGLRRSRRRAVLSILGLLSLLVSFTALKAYNERPVVLSPAEPMTIAGEEIRIPIGQIEDGHLHRFAWNASDGTEVRFIVIKKSAAAYGVGLDACDICGNTGYYERKDEVICRLCDVVMNKSTIGFRGGCNPVPLDYSLRDGGMIVRLSDLENEKGRFK